MCPGSIPVFLGDASIGPLTGRHTAMIRDFDVYYTSPLLVGFHVLGSGLPSCVPDLYPFVEDGPEAPPVWGFYALGIQEHPIDFCPTGESAIYESGVVAFYATPDFFDYKAPDLVVLGGENTPQVLAFYGHDLNNNL